jgi:hypothetical protein
MFSYGAEHLFIRDYSHHRISVAHEILQPISLRNLKAQKQKLSELKHQDGEHLFVVTLDKLSFEIFTKKNTSV